MQGLLPPGNVIYVTTELEKGAMLVPYDELLFVPWCQVNACLTMPKNNSHLFRFIMDLSWPHPPDISVNAFTPRDMYMGSLQEDEVASC